MKIRYCLNQKTYFKRPILNVQLKSRRSDGARVDLSVKSLIHNGVLVPRYDSKGFHVRIMGEKIALTPMQEEMAVAWVKKIGTEYVKDRKFTANFFSDYKKTLGLKDNLQPENFDFSEIQSYLEEEKNRKLNMSREEKKIQAQTRKALRESNKEKYGYAYVDGEKVEVANYVAEPSCIFMGRGKHPLRGRWKQGPAENDVILNLSPDAPTPLGNWKGRVWQPDSMWIAKWDDKLGGKEKYVWLAETSTLKQKRDIEKLEKASELAGKIEVVAKHIMANLDVEDIERRKVATVCYLIDALKMRVGDEKDEDEADTVGATTLRPRHVWFSPNGTVTFDFLGKDSVRWHREIKLPEKVIRNLKEFTAEAKSSIFEGVRSDVVSLFLNEVLPGLTAKVFRTYYASKAVKDFLRSEPIHKWDPDYLKKYKATMANLQAAVVCNHKRKLPKTWKKSLQKQYERIKKLKLKLRGKSAHKAREKIREIETKIKLMKATKDYNLRTSLKSYIDPRVYLEWSRKVGFDWKQYYPKTLQRKFSWIEEKQL